MTRRLRTWRVGLLMAAALACALPSALAENHPLSPQSNQALEDRLASMGFFAGAPDGEWDEETTTAVGNFQTANHLIKTGELDEETVQLLRAGEGVGKQEYLNGLAQRYGAARIVLGVAKV